MKDDALKIGYRSAAKRIGINYFQLYRILNGISKGTIETWEKIINYYS
jgi:hypothetical protein